MTWPKEPTKTKPESTEPRNRGSGMGREGHGDAIVGADLGQTGPEVAVWAVLMGGTGGRGKRSLAHPARVEETFDWMVREGVVVAQLLMGASGREQEGA